MIYIQVLKQVFTQSVHVCVTGIASALAAHIAPSLDLKVENQEKDDMNDNQSSDDLKSDDESDKRDMKQNRGSTRPRQGNRSSKHSL